MEIDFRKLTQEQKIDIYIIAFILVPILVVLYLVLSYEEPRYDTNSNESKTWYEVMSPEMRQKTGVRDPSTFVQPDNSTNSDSQYESSVFEKEDIYDIIDYNGGLDGEYSDVDYHDMEEYYKD